MNTAIDSAQQPDDPMPGVSLKRTIGNRGLRVAAVLCVLTIWVAPAPAAGVEPEPARGMLLVASRSLLDGNFAASVVLLTRYSKDGAMGLVINRPIGVDPMALLTDIEGIEGYRGKLHGGGPVSIHRIFILIRSSRPPESAQHVFDDVYASHSRDLLEALRPDLPDDDVLRFYAGYAGWGAGQLDAEIDRGDWHVVAATVEIVFAEHPDKVWERLLPPPPSIIAERGMPTASGASR